MKPLVIALAFAGLSQAQDKTLTGIEVIERYRKATNAETLEKAENHVITSKMEFVGRGMSGTVVEYRKKPKLHYSEAEFEGVGKIVSGSDGTVAWTSNPMQGPRLMDGDELKQTLRRGVNDWKEKQAQYTKIENAGSETVEGEDCYKVVLTLADGGRQDTQFYSKASGLLLKQITTAANPMGEMKLEIFTSDYKKLAGVLMPTKIRQSVMGTDIAVEVQKLELDVDLPAGKFSPPADIKQLIDKKNAPAK